MSVYVDPLFGAMSSDLQARRVGARHGHQWCHMWSDTPGDDGVAELVRLARSIGLKDAWIQRSRSGLVHYDLTPTRRAAALAAGAVSLERHAAVESMRRAREASR